MMFIQAVTALTASAAFLPSSEGYMSTGVAVAPSAPALSPPHATASLSAPSMSALNAHWVRTDGAFTQGMLCSSPWTRSSRTTANTAAVETGTIASFVNSASTVAEMVADGALWILSSDAEKMLRWDSTAVEDGGLGSSVGMLSNAPWTRSSEAEGAGGREKERVLGMPGTAPWAKSDGETMIAAALMNQGMLSSAPWTRSAVDALGSKTGMLKNAPWTRSSDIDVGGSMLSSAPWTRSASEDTASSSGGAEEKEEGMLSRAPWIRSVDEEDEEEALLSGPQSQGVGEGMLSNSPWLRSSRGDGVGEGMFLSAPWTRSSSGGGSSGGVDEVGMLANAPWTRSAEKANTPPPVETGMLENAPWTRSRISSSSNDKAEARGGGGMLSSAPWTRSTGDAYVSPLLPAATGMLSNAPWIRSGGAENKVEMMLSNAPWTRSGSNKTGGDISCPPFVDAGMLSSAPWTRSSAAHAPLAVDLASPVSGMLSTAPWSRSGGNVDGDEFGVSVASTPVVGMLAGAPWTRGAGGRQQTGGWQAHRARGSACPGPGGW